MAGNLNVQGPRLAVTGITTAVVNLVTSPLTTAIALPLNANGDHPAVVRVVASQPVIVHFASLNTAATTTCVITDPIFTSNPDYIAVRGFDRFTCALHTTNALTSVLNITPVEF